MDEETVPFVRQWRYIASRLTLEMPTGRAHPDKPPANAARRELAEETSYRAGRLDPLITMHTSKSVVDKVAHLYVANDLVEVEVAATPAPTEQIELVPLRFDEAVQLVRSGEIVDAMTVAAVLAVALDRLS